jgi:fructoselysine-6-P-deglycase FrlB-like protein
MGGSYFNVGAAWYLLDQYSTHVAAFLRTSAAFVARPPALVGPASLVIAASTSGHTEESIDAVDVAAARGATVAALTATPQSPITAGARHTFGFGSTGVVTEPAHVLALLIGYGLLECTGVELDYRTIWEGLEALPHALVTALSVADEMMPDIAREIAANEVTYVLAGGPNFGVASGARRSFLTEPRRIEPEHSGGESVHGVFDALDEEMNFLVYVGEDDARAQAESVHGFLSGHSQRTMLIDSRSFPLPGVDEVVRPHLSPVLLAAVSRRLSDHIEAQSGFDAVEY